jgi:hypothetical protein
MTRTYALLRLLDHGALAMSEIITITGWPVQRARQTVSYLSEFGRIKSVDGKWAK